MAHVMLKPTALEHGSHTTTKLKKKLSTSFEREHINGNIINSESEETEARKADILGQETHQKRKQSNKGLNDIFLQIPILELEQKVRLCFHLGTVFIS